MGFGVVLTTGGLVTTGPGTEGVGSGEPVSHGSNVMPGVISGLPVTVGSVVVVASVGASVVIVSVGVGTE